MANYTTANDLKVNDKFYANRDLGWVILLEISGFSFYTGKIAFWVKVCKPVNAPDHAHVSFKQDKKIRLYE